MKARPTRHYNTEGYDPDDGLEEGHWARHPGGIWKWVPDEPGLHLVPDLDEPDEPIACPTCGVTATQGCRTRDGHRTRSHPNRLIPRLCACGEPLGWKRRSCEGCRAESRRQAQRAYRLRQLEAS